MLTEFAPPQGCQRWGVPATAIRVRGGSKVPSRKGHGSPERSVADLIREGLIVPASEFAP